MSKKLLILTPDGVGSTLLQRAICVFGNIEDKWINTHELTNGLSYSIDGILYKDNSHGYSQSLSDIILLLEKNNNNIIVRLAHYHLIARKDKVLPTDHLIHGKVCCSRNNFNRFLVQFKDRKFQV